MKVRILPGQYIGGEARRVVSMRAAVLENKAYAGAGLEYEYDYGDCWKHAITVVGRADRKARILVRVSCVDGEGHGAAGAVGSFGVRMSSHRRMGCITQVRTRKIR